ncbi:MAG: Crp/Fnr family transcriptional regulator, partial [Acidimicrobiales bacterium]
MTQTEVSDFEGRSERRAFSRGAVVVREGDEGHDVMLLRRGRLKICRMSAGREAILSIADPGSLLGELAALDGSPHSATVVSLEAAELDCMDLGAFREF